MSVNNNYNMIFKGHENICKLINGTAKYIFLLGISNYTKKFSNLFNYSCPYRRVNSFFRKFTM